MRLWLDAEFNGFKGALISMALVDDHGREWYEELKCRSPSPWVAENVIPNLCQVPVTLAVMRQSLSKFLSVYETVHLVADWPQDIQHFCELLIISPGIRINLPPLSMEVRSDLNANGSLIPHNALADARALRLVGLKQLETRPRK